MRGGPHAHRQRARMPGVGFGLEFGFGLGLGFGLGSVGSVLTGSVHALYAALRELPAWLGLSLGLG